MSNLEFCGVCRGGPWSGQEFESDVRSWRVNVPSPKPLSAAAPVKQRYGTYVWYHPNIWRWHSS